MRAVNNGGPCARAQSGNGIASGLSGFGDRHDLVERLGPADHAEIRTGALLGGVTALLEIDDLGIERRIAGAQLLVGEGVPHDLDRHGEAGIVSAGVHRRIRAEQVVIATDDERIEQADIKVVKKDGRRERFYRSKVMAGLLKACEKRSVSMKSLDTIADLITGT